MATTHIDTALCQPVKLPGSQGAVAEIVNRDLCGAKNVVAMLRRLDGGERFDAGSLEDAHQLLYLIEGAGVITLENKDFEVSGGAGVYLGPRETAGVRQAGAAPLKLLHLVVPKVKA
ncbi:MAG: hypothetical protein HYV04_07705 [Deltaproteobacteria bacterium]|nr:hypothetical protein [Deltaproteobacteria bacterium]